MSEKKQLTGKRGENLAAEYLKKNGVQIIERNYSRKHGEIDIIARDAKAIVFIEVKTRTSTTYGSPFEAITLRKQRQIARVAQDYLSRKRLHNRPARFDVIGITLSPTKEAEIEIIQDAFCLQDD